MYSEKTVQQKGKLFQKRIEAATTGVLWKKMFLRISQNSQEGLQLYLKRDSGTGVFPKNFANFLRIPFLQNTSRQLLLREDIVLIIF